MSTDDKIQSDEQTNDQSEQEDFASLQKKSEEYLHGWQRAKADYINLKKQTEKERGELIGMASAAVVLELIPIKDGLDRAWNHLPEDLQENEWIQGLEGVRKQLDGSLEKLGIQTFSPDQEDFSPNEMEAIEHRPDEKIAEGKVVETLEPGYRMQSKLIRPAKVIVSSGPEKESKI